MTTLADIIRHVSQVEAQIEALTARELHNAIVDLNDYAKQIAHKRSGKMALTQHVEGVFEIGQGVLEAVSEPGVDYAVIEVARGDDHAYDERTLTEQAGRIDELRRVLQDRIPAMIEGAR